MKVVVERDQCIGCGYCEGECPEVFQLDDENISTVINNNPEKIDMNKIKEIAPGCPTGAIKVEE